MFCIQLEHYVQRFILFVLLKKSSDHKKHQQMVFHCAHSQSQRTTESSSVSRSNSVLKCPLFFQFISSTLKALFFFPLPNFLVYCLYLQKRVIISSTFDSFHNQGSNSLRPVTIVLQSRHPDNISSRVLWRLWPVVTFWSGYWRCWDAYYCCGHIRLFTV